jgi:3-hydroxybutyryl-CoA dehydrogenase
VCGAGTMGSGIAQVCARYGSRTILFDVDRQTLHAAQSKITRDLQNLADKNKITAQEKAETLARITFTCKLDDCVADITIEAIVENADIKADLLNKLCSINSESSIFATNTSSLSVTAIAEKISAPSRLAGMHFFNPAPVMKLVEVVKTRYSTAETINTIIAFTESIGKTAVRCSDSPGFIVNRVARPYYLEALHLIKKEICDIETIDQLMEATGFKMGPFRLMDLIGNDINYSVTCIVHEALGRPSRLAPSELQKEKVNQGLLGRKTGKGYYDYSAT